MEESQTIIYQVAELPDYNVPLEVQISYASIGFGIAASIVVPLLVMTIIARAGRAGEGANYD